MNITKLNLGNFASNTEAEILPPAPKNFSYFAKIEAKEEPEFTKADLASRTEASQHKGFEEGYTKGRDEMMQSAVLVEQTSKAAIDNIANKIDNFFKQYEEEKRVYMKSMVKVVMMAIQKLAGNMIKENTEEIILQALERSSDVFAKQPEIIVKTKQNILEKIRDKFDNILKEKEFKGQVSFVADESVADGTCVLEWGTSGLSINSNEVLKQIDETLSEYMKSI